MDKVNRKKDPMGRAIAEYWKVKTADWLYIDADTLKEKAGRCGYEVELVAEGEHYDYLARITKK